MDMIEGRTDVIKKMYIDLLGREADIPGLKHYTESALTLEEIEGSLRGSLEFLDRQRKVNFMGTIDKIGSEDQLLMGACPSEKKHVESLQTSGVEAILNLDDTPFIEYDFKWCSSYLHLPVDQRMPLSVEIVEKAITFIYQNIHGKGLKTLIHSRTGLHRAPLFIVMYLVAVSGLTLMNALRLIVYKQPRVNPDRNLLTANILRFLKEFNQRIKSGEITVNSEADVLNEVFEGVYAGTLLTSEDCFNLNKSKIDTILNLGPVNCYLSPATKSFEVLGIPMSVSTAVMSISKLFAQLDSLVSIINKKIKEEKRVFLYSSDDSIVSLAAMAYLVKSGNSVDKASTLVGRKFPTLFSKPILKNWLQKTSVVLA